MNRKILICLIALVCSQFILFTLNAVEAAKTVDTTKTTEAVKVTEVAVTKTKDDKVTHRYDFTNNGPSVLTSASTFSVSYPSVVINTKPLLQLSELVCYYYHLQRLYVLYIFIVF